MFVVKQTFSRTVSVTTKDMVNRNVKMKAWQVNSYYDPVTLEEARVPTITKPDDVLIRILASSVNPLDTKMAKGFGSNVMSKLRKAESGLGFPLTFGRDFVGEVVASGQSVKLTSDKVWGVVPAHLPGSHAQYLVVPAHTVMEKPESINDIEACSLLYAGVTAYSALQLFGLFDLNDSAGKRVLVLGGSGGVGTTAIQMLRAAGATVVTTCSNDAVPLVRSLGAHLAIDYRSTDFVQQIVENEPYDLILECAGQGSSVYLRSPWRSNRFVTLTSPTLEETDEKGLLFGTMSLGLQIVAENVQSFRKGGKFVIWAYFMPCRDAIIHLGKLVERQKIKPVIDSIYTFSKVDEAYTRVEKGKLRGKVVIDHVQER